MQAQLVKSKDLKGLNRRLEIIVPVADIDGKVEARLKKYGKTAKMDGFRPGKIPFGVLEKRYGDSARYEVLDKVIQESFYKAAEEQNLKVAGHPKINITQDEKGKDLKYTADFEVHPEIELKGFESVKLEQFASEVTDKDIDTVLERVQKQYAEWEKVTRVAKDGDRVIIDFEGFLGKKPFEGGKAEKHPLILGSHSMIPGFEEGIVGAKVDEERDVKVTFPKEYHSKELAGKKATFKIKVHEIFEPKLPKVDDDFAKKIGVKEGGVKKLRDNVRQSMEKELVDGLKVKNKQAVMDKLLELNKIELPNALVESEMENLYQNANQQYQSYTRSKQNLELPREHFKKDAERRVALGLLVGAGVQKYDIKPDSDRVRESIEQFARSYEKPEQILEWYQKNPQHLAQFQMLAVEDQVVEKLLSEAKVTEKKVSFNELMGK